MDAGKTYFAAQKASDLHSASGNPLASLDGLLPTASTCSVLGKLQSLPRHRPANPSQNSTVARISPQGVLEQLSWSDHRVVWTLGDSIERIFDFESARQDPGPSAFNDSAHHVRQALWTKFRFEAQEPTATGTSPSVIGLSSTDTPQEKANKLFGPFAKPLAEKWSDAPSATASTTPKQNQKERILDAICVILAEELHIFFPSTGQSIVVHLPLLVQHAWPLPDTGLLLSRHLEVDEEASQPLGIDAPLPTLYALQDVYEELRFVSMRPQPILTSPTTPGSSERFTSTRTEVLLVDSATHSVVFVDRSSCRLQVCCLADVEPHPIPAPCLDDAQDNAPPSLDASMQKIGAPKRPSKSSNTMSPPPQAGPQVAGMSTAAFDRTFMDDRAHQPDNAAMPNEREDPQLHQSTFWNHFELVPLWESRDTLDLRSDDVLRACFVHQTGHRQSLLAVLNSRLETVFVFGCSWSAERESLISVSEVAAFPAVFIHNCLCTRDTDRDLLLIGADGQLSLINSNGWQLALPWSVPDPASVKVVDSLVIYPSPSSPSITTIHNLRQIPAPSDSLTGRCWRGLSQVLTDDEFMKLYKTDFEQGITDDHWTRFRRLFTHDDQPEQSSEDLFQRLLVSKAPGRSSVGPSRRLSNLVNLPMVARAIPRLHGILQDYLCQKTNAVVTPLGFLLADLARLLRWRNWYDYYLRQGFRVDPPPNEMPMVEEPPYPEDTIALLANLLQSGIDPTRHSDQEIAQTDLDHDSRDAARLVQSFMSLCQSGSQASPASSLADKAIAVSKTLSGAHDAMPPVELSKYAAFSVLPVRESIRLVLSKPPVDQPASFYDFIGRRDLARQMGQSDEHVHQPTHFDAPPSIGQCCSLKEEVVTSKSRHKADIVDPLRPLPQASPELPLFNDRRLEEVNRILRWSRPLVVRMRGVSNDSGEPPTQQQKIEFASLVASRTQSVATGAALFTFATRSPLKSNESPSVADINLSVRLLPFDEQITLDLNALPGERRRWPKFHTGVAVALQQCGEFTSENPFDSSKRTFSRPSRHDLDSRHAGYLLGLGLTGQIRSIAVFQVFEYLDPKHDLTSIAILLGMATAFIGSADATVSSMLAVHLQAVHPSGSAELNISLMIQSAAMLSHGLLYMGTRHRGLSDKILKELSRNVLRNKEHAEDCREAYALSSGMALGFIMLGSGKENRHLENDALLAKLKALIDSGGQHALRDPAEGQTIDVSITSPAAIAALGLVFLDSHREDVLELLALPESEDQLDYIRPDLILLKTTAQCLVQFSSIEPSKQWVLSHLPTYVKRAVNRKQVPGPTDSTDIELSFWSAVTGTCFAIGLRYAGTASVQAYKTLMEYLQLIIRPSISRPTSVRAKLRHHTLTQCVGTLFVSLAMVFAGTGELHILQTLRHVHGQLGDASSFSMHFSAHTALGLLFLGRGRQTLSSKAPGQLAALFIAFYPVWPRSPSDNQMHLQAYRHLWTLAVEPRCLKVKDVTTNQFVHLPIYIYIRLPSCDAAGAPLCRRLESAPTLLPELSTIHCISVQGARYWPTQLYIEAHSLHRQRLVDNQTLYVKRHAGRFDYTSDPRGIKGITARSDLDTDSLITDLNHLISTEVSWDDLQDVVASCSSNPVALATLKYLGVLQGTKQTSASDKDLSSLMGSFASSVVKDTLTHDKAEVAPIYHELLLDFESCRSPSGCTSNRSIASLTLSLAFYASLTWRKIFRPDNEPQYAAELPLLQRPFVERLRAQVDEISITMLKSADVRSGCVAYIQGDPSPSESVVHVLNLLRAPYQHQLQELSASVATALQSVTSQGGTEAQSLIATAAQRALTSLIPFSQENDHWHLAQLVVEAAAMA